MTVFILAFAGAFAGSLAGVVVMNILKRVEAKAEPGTTVKKVLQPVVAPGNEAPVNTKAFADWLYHKEVGQ